MYVGGVSVLAGGLLVECLWTVGGLLVECRWAVG